MEMMDDGITATRNAMVLTVGETIIANCIIWGNSDSHGSIEAAQVRNNGGTLAVGYSCVQGWSGGLGGLGNIGQDPQLAGGADVCLLTTSPCIDAGNNMSVPPDVTVDLYGRQRFADLACVADTGSGNIPLVDMGACEHPAVPADIDCEGIFDDGDGSGIAGDNPCTGGNSVQLDDN